jgi:EpsI family protein
VTRVRGVAAAFAMFLAAGLAAALVPRHRMAEAGAPIDLALLIPSAFGEWKIDPQTIPISVSPDLQARLDRIYTQTLARTYVNDRGERIMLSVAYGADQRGDMQVHKPEICYPAQGFEVLSNVPHTMHTPFGEIPVRRLATQLGARHEPVTYWMTVGGIAATGSLQRKVIALRYGLGGTVPDGFLFRVSSVERDTLRAFETQAEFVSELLQHILAPARTRLAALPDR